jgi:hypothetical protein
MANLDFDVQAYEASQPMGKLPAGNYRAIISGTQEKTSKAGARYVELTLEVIDGPHKGSKVWDNLNLWHPNEQPRNIARSTLRSISDAVGVHCTNTDQLCNRPLTIEVLLEDSNYNGTPTKQNRIKSYAKDAGPSSQPQQARYQPPAQQQQGGNGSPW